MAPVFQSPARPARRRRLFLTRAEIVETAAEILERDGYDALNMRSLADALGVKAAALYRYVDSRDQLDDLLFDHLMADCPFEVAGQDWRQDLRELCGAWRAQLLARRDATRIALGRVSIGPNLIRLMEAALTILRRSGLADPEVIDAYQTATLFVHGFASQEAWYLNEPGAMDDPAERFTPPDESLLAAHPAVAAFAPALLRPVDFDARFDFGIGCLIAGIDWRAGAARASGAPGR